MSYTGDPTVAQSPSPIPAADGSPVLNDVVDGTADNSASITQQLKALADNCAFSLAPRALAAAGLVLSNWAKPVLAYRTALLHRRTVVDHQGFVGGQVLTWDEDWGDHSNVAVTNTSAALLGTRWLYQQTDQASGGFTLNVADAKRAGGTNPYPSSRLYMEVPSTGGPVFEINAVQRAIAPIVIESAGGTAISMHWDQAFNLAGINNTSAGQLAMGLTATGVVSGSTALFGASGGLNPIGVAFVGGQGTGTAANNWKAYVNFNGTFTLYDTGVTCNTDQVRRRFRIDVIGAAVSDDATARVMFWIDGTLVKSVAVDLTNGGNGVPLIPFFRQWGEGQAFGANIGPVRFRANLWPTDVFI